MSETNLPASVVEAFHLMWNNFPEPVSLVHKSRTVIAINKAHQKMGVLQPGMNCAKLGDKPHVGCLANQALKSGEATYSFNNNGDREIIGYWIPIDGYPEYFVHFGVGVQINYRQTQNGQTEEIKS